MREVFVDALFEECREHQTLARAARRSSPCRKIGMDIDAHSLPWGTTTQASFLALAPLRRGLRRGAT